MGIVLPQNLDEWLPLLVPLATLAIALVYFLAPRRVLAFIGLAPRPHHPEAIGEARSRFAGFPAGIAISFILFGQPILLTMLGMAWTIAAWGKLNQFLFDATPSKSAILRFFLALLLAAIALYQAAPETPEFIMPDTRNEWIVSGIAALSALFGWLCLLLPRAALAFLRLEATIYGSHGELRGTVAGFYLATGFCVLAYGGIFLQFALALAWCATAFGRLISIFADRGNNRFNWILLAVEIAFGSLPLLIIFGMIN